MGRVLVTGGMGAIGSATVRWLVEHGHRPVVFDRQGSNELVADLLDDIDVEVGDLRSWGRLAEVIRRHDVERIIHLAVLLPAEAAREPAAAVDVNVAATTALLDLARVMGLARVVFASSKGVYRPFEPPYSHPEYRPVDEDHPIGPHDMYDITKYAAEQIGLDYARRRGVDFVALRFAATYGPGRMLRHGTVAIRSAIVENAWFGRPTILPSGADQQDDFVYTKDIAQALGKATFAQGLTDRVFNIGTGLPSTLAVAADILRRELPGARIEIGPGPDYGTGSGHYCIFDIGRARRQLGYEPEFDHERGILDYLAFLAVSAPRG